VQRQGGGPIPSAWSPEVQRDYLMRLEALFLFAREQLWIGMILAAIFGALLLLTLAGKLKMGEEDGFLLLSLLAILLYALSPEGMSGGALIKNRLSLYPYLFLLPWLAPRIGRTGRAAVAAALVLLTVFQVGLTVHRYRLAQPEVREFLAATAPIAPDSRVLPILFTRGTNALGFGMLGHLIGYPAAEKGLIDWANYEAWIGYFPVRFRPEMGRMDNFALEAHPEALRLAEYRGRVDYVLAWKMPPDLPLGDQLRRQYRPLAEIGPGSVYKRRKGGGMRE
jgi:hypothetical protein